MEAALAPEIKPQTAIVRSGNHFDIAILRERTFESGVFEIALQGALTGHIPVVNDKGRKWSERITTALQVELMLKLINKAMPNAKEPPDPTETKEFSKWADLLVKEQEIITREDALEAKREARGPIEDKPGRRK